MCTVSCANYVPVTCTGQLRARFRVEPRACHETFERGERGRTEEERAT
jgi:hypothetical protein